MVPRGRKTGKPRDREVDRSTKRLAKGPRGSLLLQEDWGYEQFEGLIL